MRLHFSGSGGNGDVSVKYNTVLKINVTSTLY